MATGAGLPPPERLSASDIQNKFDNLRQSLPQETSLNFSVKIAVLLDRAGLLDNIQQWLRDGITDYWMPISQSLLPVWLSPTGYNNFGLIQPAFLQDTLRLHCGHVPLSPAAMQNNTIRGAPIDLPKSLIHKRYIGTGGSGSVFEVKVEEKPYALKIIKREGTSQEQKFTLKCIKEEIEVLKKVLNHRHCVQLVGSYGESRTIGIVMDPVADYNLQDYMDSFLHRSFQERLQQRKVLATFFGCLATTLAYLQNERQIRHKDIKPSNILVKGDNVLFTDFGVSLDWEERGYTTTIEEKRITRTYCSPEAAIDGQKRNSKSDIWPLGCVFLEMMTVLKGKPRGFVEETLGQTGSGSPYFRDNPEGIKQVIDALSAEGTCDNKPLEWIELMLQRHKDDRPGSRELASEILKSCGQTGLTFCGPCCTGIQVNEYGQQHHGVGSSEVRVNHE